MNNFNPDNMVFFYLTLAILGLILFLMALPTLIANEVERRQKKQRKK